MGDLFSEARKKISRARYKGTGVAMSRSEAMALLEKIDRLRAENAELREVSKAALAWIDAVPSDTELPTMPGFDRDWADSVLDKARGETDE